MHRAVRIVAPLSNTDFGQTAVAGRKQRRVPTKQALRSEDLVVPLGGIEHHIHHTVHLPVRRRQGTDVNGIENYADKIVTRGVLLDIPKYKGKPWLEPGEGISADDLAGCAKSQGVTVERGVFRAHMAVELLNDGPVTIAIETPASDERGAS